CCSIEQPVSTRNRKVTLARRRDVAEWLQSAAPRVVTRHAALGIGMVQCRPQCAEDTVGGGTAAPYRVLMAVALGQPIGHASQPVPQLLGGQSLHRHSA